MNEASSSSQGAGASVARASRYDEPISPTTKDLWDEIRRLDLTYNIAELDVLGYTVVPPEKVAPPEFIERLRNKIIEIAARRSGIAPDLVGGSTHSNLEQPIGGRYTYMLLEDPVFQEAMCNPVGLALTTYLLGKSAVASNCLAVLKGPGNQDLGLHSDHVLCVPPFPANPEVCNVTFALTDYTKDNGALCFVPGSHKYYRQPLQGEALDQRVAVECAAGSLLFWGGNVWHGAFARKNPGLRINLIMAMMRPNMRPQEPYREHITQDILDRNPPRFSVLMGKHINYGWMEEGPQDEATKNLVSRHAYD